MTEDSLFVANRFGEKLEAVLRKPSGSGQFPSVLFVSGFGMDLHEYIRSNDEISQRLVPEGILTLQFSFAGCGKSEGDYGRVTLERQAQQIEDMLEWLVKRDDINKSHIGVHATSMGVPSTLLTNLVHCASLCFVSGVYDVNKSIHQVYAEERGVKINYEGITQLPRDSGAKTPVGAQFWKSIAAFDAYKEIQKVIMPVLLIHGDQDTKVLTAEVQEILAEISSNKKHLKIFKGGDHGITDVPRPMREEFLKDVVTWFKETV